MCAESNFVVSIRSFECDLLMGRSWDVFSEAFILPRSAEIHLPGREVYRFPWSLEREVARGEPLPKALPAETAGPTEEFTQLA